MVNGRPMTFGNLETAVPAARPRGRRYRLVGAQFDPRVTWDDVAWVREHWDGRLVVKGVLDPEEARRAVDASNHGGRQLDSVPSTVQAPPDVVDAVGDQADVLSMAGSVRDSTWSGCRARRACRDDRPHVGVGVGVGVGGGGGRAGALRHALRVPEFDIDVALALTGSTSIERLDRSALYDGGLRAPRS